MTPRRSHLFSVPRSRRRAALPLSHRGALFLATLPARLPRIARCQPRL